jgi:NAD+ kinase
MKKVFLVTRSGLAEADLFRVSAPYGLELVPRPELAEGILVMGGDGTMLKAIRAHRTLGVPFLGLNFGHIGFLMNEARPEVLGEIVAGAVELVPVRLLQADLQNPQGQHLGRELAFNDCYFERTSTQTVRMRISVNGKVRFESLTCDGVLVSTAAGSTAYNASAGGMILPIQTNALVLTGICPALFHRWRSSQLAADARITLEPLDTAGRPVRFLVDGIEIAGVTKADIGYSECVVRIGFAASQNFYEKVLRLQFNSH